ncbi:MarR family transcriptional regulator [Bradyrhizobium sp. CCGB12]|uniref:MarR family winged helix-turn-helix transcriptional regulator n=1 Tax=Bradyrhizobium sp. CCGB12 TaxID=2949632 RepID=UPI0020B336EC|nr:MarR family transcriptional regulator [Bradyrhizobium sp. CCGB12]MCP3387836.1 MarR family transcriptional regulator [Bradyrhizobium sp. CCGB12]
MVQVCLTDAFYERFGDLEISCTEFSVLSAARANPGTNQGEIANALMIKRSNMTKIVNNLAKRKLLTRSSTNSDKRAVTLQVTKTGAQLLDLVEAQVLQQDRAAVFALSSHERHTLLGLLGKVADSYKLKYRSSSD